MRVIPRRPHEATSQIPQRRSCVLSTRRAFRHSPHQPGPHPLTTAAEDRGVRPLWIEAREKKSVLRPTAAKERRRSAVQMDGAARA